MKQSKINLLQRQKQNFSEAFQELSEELQLITDKLTKYYQQSIDDLESGQYIFNTSIMKEIRMYLSQVSKIVNLAGNGNNLFLLKINSLKDQEPVELDVDQLIERYRDKTEIPLRRCNLDEKSLTKIKNRCSGVNSLQLYSNQLKIQDMIRDQDLRKIQTFNKISRLSIRGSNVSDLGLQNLAGQLQNLKMISNDGLKRLSGYKFVSIKANNCEGISQRGVLSLISTSYNLNYLQITNIRHSDDRQLLEDIRTAYSSNNINFKWLQLICSLGTILFVNKLSYLTHLTNADSITDRQVEILLGEQPLIDGLYFNCCEELHSDTINLIVNRCNRLKRLCLRRFLNLTDALVSDVVSNLVKLEYLDLSECFEISSKSVIQMANQLRKLKQINLSKCMKINDDSLIYLVQKMPSIIAIDVSYCKNITDESIYHICNSLPNLISLNIQKCEQITNQSISYLSQKLLLLQGLILNFCEHISDDSLSLVAMRLRKLRRLQIQWCPVTQMCIAFIAENLNELQRINFNYCPSVCDEAFFSLAKHAVKLHTLKIQSCDKLSTKAFLRLFESLKHLRYLDLKECIGVNDLAIQQLCNKSRGQLIYLDLSWCSNITDHAMLSLSQFQQQILSLNLNGCSLISDSAVVWICSTMSQLQYLNLSLCDKITDRSVLQISNSLQSLRILYLSDLNNLTDNSVSSLSNIHNIQELHLSGCHQITSSSLIALLHNLEKLQCLNISQCSNIFAQSLLLLIERMRNLKKFSVASLQVEDKLLWMVGEYMTKLQSINLQYCRKISDQAVIKMMQRIPSLIHIDLQNTNISQRSKQIIFQEISFRSAHFLFSKT